MNIVIKWLLGRLPFLFLLVMIISGCDGKKSWNVLLVTFDTTRADHIGSYGNVRIQTPTLDRLAAEGVRFADAVSAVPITGPSHTTILTGRYPMAHGFRDNGLFVIDQAQLTLAEILREQGYATAAAVGAYPVVGQFGFDQGFDFFDDHLTGQVENHLGNRAIPKQRLFFDERRAAQVNEAVLPWLHEHAADPFFLWVHYFDPHQPFEPPPPYDQLYADDLYNGEIAYTDSRLGFLLQQLEQLGVLDNTLIVMTADHGEGLGEHNELTHAMLAYNTTLHVPLIIRAPAAELPAGTVIEQRVGTVDILPTILDLLNIELPDGLQGRSLMPLVQGSGSEGTYYAENLSPRLSHGWGELRILFEGAFKYIHGPRPELYNLDTDPHEQQDLIHEQADRAQRMRGQLERFLSDYTPADMTTAPTVDPAVLQRLQSLGYLHSNNADQQVISETLRDDGVAPQDRVTDLNSISSAKHLLFKGRFNDALVYTHKLMVRDRHSPIYLELHASALAGSGQLDAAWQVLEQLEEQGAIPEPLLLQLSTARFLRGDDQAAVLNMLERHAAFKSSSQAYWLLGKLYQETGDQAQASKALKKALALEPKLAPARADLAILYANNEQYSAAEREFLRALSDYPYSPKTSYNYGAFLYQSARLAEAEVYFQRAIALAPYYMQAHLALVSVYFEQGRDEQAQAAASVLNQLAPDSDAAITANALLATLSSNH